MKLVDTKCALCGSSEDYIVVYKKNFEESDFNIGVFSARRMPDRVHYQIVKCKNDNLVRSNPIIDEDSVVRLYQQSKFTYKEETKSLSDSYLAALKPVLDGLPKTAKILEIGCGNGFLLKRLHDMGYENVFGIEPSVDALNQADDAVKKNIVAGALKAETFKSAAFDLIFFFQTLDHIQEPNKFLQICHGLLKPGGFILSFNHDVNSLQAKFLGERSPIIDIEHAYLYNKETMRKLFEKNNFKVLMVCSPFNTISLRHLIWLAPMPKAMKNKLLNSKTGILRSTLAKKIKLKLGNLCLIAKS